MTRRSATISRADEMGQVHVPVAIANYEETARADLGAILADSGASHLCLPVETIQELRLRHIADVVVQTAAGASATRLYGPLWLAVDGRRRLVSCLELPGGKHPLLGAIAMEELGLELDLKGRTYWLRPDDGPESYLTA